MTVIEELTLNHFLIARPASFGTRDYSVSIVIPCRNEHGNSEDAVSRIPEFGVSQEIIFVEGGSTDGTYAEIERVIANHPAKHITVHQQTGKGKGDAVRLGFSHAKNDLLMILDADLTTPPETLPKFYHALAHGKGDFINGSRLVYPMENEAMRFLNLLGNKFFSVAFSWLLGQPVKDTLCGTPARSHTKPCCQPGRLRNSSASTRTSAPVASAPSAIKLQFLFFISFLQTRCNYATQVVRSPNELGSYHDPRRRQNRAAPHL